MALHVNSLTFEQEVLKSSELVLVDFYADWCGPCQMLAPILEDISDSDIGVKVCKVNTDKALDLAMKYNVNSIPALFLFKNGKIVAQTVGFHNKPQLLEFIEGGKNAGNA